MRHPTLLLRGRAARRVAVFALLGAIIGVAAAEAQTRPQPPKPPARPGPRAGNWELSGGVGFVSGYDLGSATAGLTRNTTSGADLFPLFDSDSRVAGAGAFSGRVARYFSPRLSVEGGVRYARPVNRISLTADAESAPDTVAEQTLTQYVFDASVVWHFPQGPPERSRRVPFVFGGGGYLRELHEGEELIDSGRMYHAGGGMKFWFGRVPRRIGLRAEAALSFRDGGLDFEDKLRMIPVAGVSAVFLF